MCIRDRAYGAPSAYGLDGASAKLLTFSEEMPPIRLGGWRFVGFPVRREVEAARLPGCLTSESEERETWTAESLRTASSNGEGFGFPRKRAVEETSAVNVLGHHLMSVSASNRRCGLKSGTSSKRVISRDQNLIQLESLILAQSERWRQA